MNDNVEVEIPSRPYAKKTGRPVSASKQLPTRPAVQVESAKSVTVPNGTTERSAGKEAAVAANVSASVIRETPSRHTADEPSVLAEAASATHVTDAQQQKAANTPSRVATKNPNDKLLPTNDAAEAVKRAVEDVVLRARTTTLPTRAIETTMAVDLPPSHQAAAASSSGSFRPVRQFATLTSAVDKGSKQGSTVPNTSAAITQPRPTLYITQPRPTLYPPSRMEASAKAAAGASAKHNGTSIGDKPSIPAPADVQTKAAEPATSRLPAVFPPLSREDSVESSLPDLSDLFKHTTTRHARALAQDSDNSEVLFVKSSLGFGHGAKRRGKHGKTTTVKEESKDA